MTTRGNVKARFWRAIAVGLAVLVMALMPFGAAHAQDTNPLLSTTEPITLAARVVNGTAGANVPPSMIVTLQVYRGEEEIQRLEAETGDAGRVSFPGVVGDRDVTYALSTVHQEVRFFSDSFLAELERDGPLTLSIYEPVSDPSVIRIVGDSSVVTPILDDAGTLGVIQVTTYENTSDRAFVGSDPSNTRLTVRLPLPPLAFDLDAAHSPGSLVLAPASRDVYSILPILPGVQEMIVTYRALYTTNVFLWSKTYAYETGIARLLVPTGLTVSGTEEWTQHPETEVSGVTYHRYEVMDLPAGANIAVTIGDLPTSAGARSRNLEGTLRTIAIVVAAGAVAGAAVYALYWALRRRSRNRSRQNDSLTEAGAGEEVIAQLAELDDDREAGTIAEDEYTERRQALRGQLRRIIESEQTP